MPTVILILTELVRARVSYWHATPTDRWQVTRDCKKTENKNKQQFGQCLLLRMQQSMYAYLVYRFNIIRSQWGLLGY